MNTKLNEIYLETLEKLKNGIRPQIKLNQEIIELIKSEWKLILEHKGPWQTQSSKLKELLCILDNTQNSTSELNELFIETLKTLQNFKDHELIVYALGASQKHVIAESFKSGKMISLEYFDILKKLLKEGHPEVKEWTLRTIESMGPLSLRFRKEVLKAKPGLIKYFNAHQKASAQIITYLEQEWKRMKL